MDLLYLKSYFLKLFSFPLKMEENILILKFYKQEINKKQQEIIFS